MCRKLQDQGLVIYRPYKGASLTLKGKQLAHRLLRRHRLWEVFLVEKLGFEHSQAHEIACELEHTTPDLLSDRLDAFLTYPKVNPREELIPRADGSLAEHHLRPLTTLSAGQRGHVVRCDVDDAATRAFLGERGIRPGSMLTVVATANNSLLVQVNETCISLARKLAEAVQSRSGTGNQERIVAREKGG